MMKEIKINENDNDQRLDRFLVKFFPNATKSFLMKMLRKKNIVLNGKKASGDERILTGDVIKVFFSDETFEKFTEAPKRFNPNIIDLNIVYEDENIAIIDKDEGVLSHATKDGFEKNVVDSFIKYLIDKKEFSPRNENTFRPALANRLDRNTKGLLIGCKNYEALKEMTKLIKDRKINKYYKTIVKGNFDVDETFEVNYEKNEKKNMMKLSDDGSEMITHFKSIYMKNNFTELEVLLLTGKTHQIRFHLKTLRHPIVGDRKYGDAAINARLANIINNQLLYSYKISFPKLDGFFNYLSNKEFYANGWATYDKVKEVLFKWYPYMK